jgi:hypothetical protein
MKLVIKIFFTFIILEISAQGGVGPSNVVIPKGQPQSGVIDGVYEKKDVLAKKRAIPYEYVRENDYVWGKRTWSYIDLREKINHPLYYPLEEIDTVTGELLKGAQGRFSLYFILKTALEKGQIMGYFDKREPTAAQINAAAASGAGVSFNVLRGGDAFNMPAIRDYSLNASQDSKYQADIVEMIGELTPGKQDDKKVFDQSTNSLLPVYHLNGVGQNAVKTVKVYTAKNKNDAETLDVNTETTDPSKAEKDASGQPATVSFQVDLTTYRKPETIIKYLLKEDWYFDKEKSELQVRTIGIAPVIQTDSGEVI